MRRCFIGGHGPRGGGWRFGGVGKERFVWSAAKQCDCSFAKVLACCSVRNDICDCGDQPNGAGEKAAADQLCRGRYFVAGDLPVDRGHDRDVLEWIDYVDEVQQKIGATGSLGCGWPRRPANARISGDQGVDGHINEDASSMPSRKCLFSAVCTRTAVDSWLAQRLWRAVPGQIVPQRVDDDMTQTAVDAAWGIVLRGRAGRASAASTLKALQQDTGARELLSLYAPLVDRSDTDPIVVAHLGQSLDGRIATVNGASYYITGSADLDHNHRMRALADAVVVGAGTVRLDDPRLTVRRVPGESPTRVVLDTERDLGSHYRVFRDGGPPTLLCCAADKVGEGSHGQAEVIGVRRSKRHGLDLTALLDMLGARGLVAVFVEGGGTTVSRFLEAKILDRLQITISPLILGAGRPGIMLPEIAHPSDGLRPPVRQFRLGEDVLFDCVLRD